MYKSGVFSCVATVIHKTLEAVKSKPQLLGPISYFGLAPAGGIEPPISVLETAVLPLALY